MFDVYTASKPLGVTRYDLTPTHLRKLLAVLVHRNAADLICTSHKKVIMTTIYLIHFKMTVVLG